MSFTKRGSVLAGLLLSFSFSTSSVGAMTKDALLYQGLKHESRDRIFTAVLERDHAKAKRARARYVLDMENRLASGGATSAFTLSNAAIQMASSAFDVARASSTIKEAETMEKIWVLRRDWEMGNGVETLGAVAKHYVDARENRVTLVKDLISVSREAYREVAFQHDRMRRLMAARSISADEYNVSMLAHEEAKGLVKLADDEMKLADDQLALAKGQQTVSNATDALNSVIKRLAEARRLNNVADIRDLEEALRAARETLVKAEDDMKKLPGA